MLKMKTAKNGKLEKENYRWTKMCQDASCFQKHTHFVEIKIGVDEENTESYFLLLCEKHAWQIMNPDPVLEDFNWKYVDIGDNEEYPIVECKLSEDGAHYEFFCPYCREKHQHGAIPGLRVAHCTFERSPFKESGYILKLKNKK